MISVVFLSVLVCWRLTPFYLVKQAGFSERSAALSTGCARMVYLFWRSFTHHVDEPGILRTGDDRWVLFIVPCHPDTYDIDIRGREVRCCTIEIELNWANCRKNLSMFWLGVHTGWLWGLCFLYTAELKDAALQSSNLTTVETVMNFLPTCSIETKLAL